MNEPNLIILAAGVSSRMKRSITIRDHDDPSSDDAASRPKSLIRLGDADRPFLDYLLSNAREAGYTDIVLVVGEHHDLMREHYGMNDAGNVYHGLTISYAVQSIPMGREKPLGTADAVLCGGRSRPDWRGAQFTVCNSDNIYSVEAMTVLRTSMHAHSLIAYDTRGLRFDPAQEYNNAIIEKDEEGFLAGIIEKPGEAAFERKRSEQGSVDVSMNIFRFLYDDIIPVLERTPVHAMRHEKEIPTALSILLHEQPRSVYCHSRNEFVPDLTSASDIPSVRKFLQEAFPKGPFG